MTTMSADTAIPFGYREAEAFLDRVTDLSAPDGPGPALDDVAAAMARLGLEPGSAVILAMASGRTFLTNFFAVLLNGLAPMPVPPGTPASRLARIGATVGAGAIVAPSPDPARFGAARAAPVGDMRAVGLPNAVPRRPGTVLMATSGTSGMFTACVHRIGSLLRNARRHAAAVGLHGTDTVLINLPLYYSYALVAQALAAFQTGAEVIVSGPPFSPPEFPSVLTRNGVTTSSLTPTIVRALLAQSAKLPPGLRMLTVGGDQIEPAHVARLLAGNPELELYLTYGLTEAGPRVSTLAAHAEPASRHGSAGLALPGVGVTLRPVHGHSDAGELLVSSDTVLVEKIGGGGRNLVRPGLVATGDLFRIDSDGYLYFMGRLSDFIVVRGEKVCLRSVRQLVQAMPGITRCATTVTTDAAGETSYELSVQMAAGGPGGGPAEADVRRAIMASLLPAERPANLRIGIADLAAFQK